MHLSELKAAVEVERRKIEALTVEAKLVAEEGLRKKNQIQQAETLIQDLEKVSALLASISEDKQTDAQNKIENLVTQGLQKIFGQDWSFHVVPSMHGKTPIVEFKVRTKVQNRILETSVLDARGAGLASVVGFLLRLVLILLSGKSSVLILDETFANLSDSYIPNLIDFIREIVDKTNLQIIMVTHEPRFADVADKCYQFTLDEKGLTQVASI